MTWGVNDIDFIITMKHGCLFCSNSDATLFFLVATIHDQILAHFSLVVTKRVGLFEQPINEGCFTMVNVGNNRNVAQIHEAPELSCLGGVAGAIAWLHTEGNLRNCVKVQLGAVGQKGIHGGKELGPDFVPFEENFMQGLTNNGE